MPRIYASDGDPIDLHAECFPDEDEAWERFGDVGDGPDGRGNCFAYEAEHPPYEYEDYNCYQCGLPLTEEDNDV